MYVGELNGNLYTIDLICHGTPSQSLFRQYVAEEKIEINKVSNFDFRGIRGTTEKELQRVSTNSKYDYWLVPFKNSLIYTENCYQCQYAKFQRVSDLTIGDSWGSQLAKSERRKGISLAIVNSEKGRDLLESANLHLEDVDIQRAIAANTQLQKPSTKPSERSLFAENIKTGYKKALWKSNRIRILKTMIKNSKIGDAVLKIRGYRQGSIEFRLTYTKRTDNQ